MRDIQNAFMKASRNGYRYLVSFGDGRWVNAPEEWRLSIDNRKASQPSQNNASPYLPVPLHSQAHSSIRHSVYPTADRPRLTVKPPASMSILAEAMQYKPASLGSASSARDSQATLHSVDDLIMDLDSIT